MKCQEPGCKQKGEPCFYPNGETEFCCWDHKAKHGFCKYCGQFWGGIESFHFHGMPGVCDECEEEIKYQNGEFDDEIYEDDFIDPDCEDWDGVDWALEGIREEEEDRFHELP
jgi:hypothetical protein